MLEWISWLKARRLRFTFERVLLLAAANMYVVQFDDKSEEVMVWDSMSYVFAPLTTVDNLPLRTRVVLHHKQTSIYIMGFKDGLLKVPVNG